jgi:tetratricopeptide (TPR) repeat protein
MDSPLNDSQLLSLIKDYTERLKHEPDADVFCQLAHSYVRLGLIDPAVTAVQQGLTHNPQHLNGQLLLAELLGENEQYDEAIEVYKESFEYEPYPHRLPQ